jgi:CubicO group peptidase (beta-lactamase class C family)
MAKRYMTIGSVTLAVTLALAGVATFRLKAQAPADVDRRIALFARYLDALRIQAGIPGLSAAIVSNRRVTWEAGQGFADIEARLRAAPDTPYRIASLTKTFTSTLLMGCVDGAALNLDAPIRNYTSDVPDASATVRHVLSMTSDAASGSRYRYDGDRFTALTPVVQDCTGTAYRVALATRVLDRLGMSDSVPGQDLESPTADAAVLFNAATLDRYRRVITRLAKPYVVRGGRAVPAEYPPRGINAAAGLISTVRDLARYDAAIDEHILVSATSRSLAWTPFVLADRRISPYALGWFSQSTAAGRAIWHYGLWPTFSSLLLKLPERDVTLILLANSDGLSARFPLADGDVSISPFARAFIAAMR